MYKIEFEMSEEQHDKLLTLVSVCGFRDIRELHNVALTIFQTVARGVAEGKKLALIDERNKKIMEIYMEFMKNITL